METNDKVILSPQKKLCGNVKVISSKSELHRLIFCSCLADAPCEITFSSTLSKDIEATISCFRALGAEIETKKHSIKIQRPADLEGAGGNLASDIEIFCNESGSTARFILPLISLVCKNGAVLCGAGKLPERPFSDLCDCLSAHGAVFSGDKMPIHIRKCIEKTENAVFEISGNISSQYLSGLLFILPFCDGTKIRLTTPLESAGYVDMTIDAMKKFGVTVTEKDGVYSSFGKYTSPKGVINACGDWSNAAFFLCGANERPVTVSGMDDNSLQPDRAILDILSGCGIIIKKENDSVTVTRPEKLLPICFDAGENPDLVPILCVFAATLCGENKISNISRLRFKESDRVATVCEMIKDLGGEIYEKDDVIHIIGKGRLRGGRVDSCNDHRIAMSAAIAAGFCDEAVEITGASAVSKSYPAFFEILKTLTEENR